MNTMIHPLLHLVEDGALLAVMDAGAYGFSVAHQFNARPRPAEILLHDDRSELIRKQETVEDIFRNCDG